jgi:hypothetical protein
LPRAQEKGYPAFLAGVLVYCRFDWELNLVVLGRAMQPLHVTCKCAEIKCDPSFRLFVLYPSPFQWALGWTLCIGIAIGHPVEHWAPLHRHSALGAYEKFRLGFNNKTGFI